MTLLKINLKDRTIKILGYKMGTPVLEPYKREIKTYQIDTILQGKAI